MSAVDIGALSAKVDTVTNRGVRQATAGSYTCTVTTTGWHLVRLQAGGGGGTSGFTKRGGSAGMYVEAKHWLVAGTTPNYTVGAGGAVGGAGGNSTFTGPNFTQTAYGGSANLGTNGRLDGNVTDGAPAVDQTGGAIGGAHGNLPSANGGYCGCFKGGVGDANGGGGGASRYAAGGAGGTTGTAGTFGSGGGGGTTGAAGGAGVFEIEFLGST